MTDRRVVLVGVDGGFDGLRAVEYGMSMARAQNRTLRLVHAYHVSAGLNPMLPAYGVQELRASGVEALAAAERRAISVDPEVRVDTFLLQGSSARALVHASVSAAAVVVGRRRVHGVDRVLAGSTSTAVAAHAKCPVLSVPGSWSSESDRHRIVVGVDGSPQGRDALAYAFAEADRRSVPLMVVKVWQVPPRWYSDVPPLQDEAYEWLESARLDLAEDLAGWSERYPNVHVARVVESSQSAAKVLVTRSEDASLLVVGARGHGGLPGLDMGWTARSVLVHSRVPVAVVHRGDAARLTPELVPETRRAG